MEESKTPDKPQPEKTKEELFAENPERFIDSEDVVLCVKRTPQGTMLMMRSRTPQELLLAMAEVQIAVMNRVSDARKEVGQARKDGIMPSKGGIISAVRGGFFKK